MNYYLKLVHMEVHRFRWVLALLMGLTAISQFSALIWTVTKELARREEEILENINNSEFIIYPKYLTFELAIFSSQMGYILPILLSIGVLVFYTFVIWYRDWFGRSTFGYRLLMLPTARRNVYLAKISAFLMFVFGLISFQLAMLPIQNFVFNRMVPADQRVDSPIAEVIKSNQALVELIPWQFEQFLYY